MVLLEANHRVCSSNFNSLFGSTRFLLFDANLAYLLSLLTNLFPLKLDLQVAKELFNCKWCYLTKVVDVEFAFAMWKM